MRRILTVLSITVLSAACAGSEASNEKGAGSGELNEATNAEALCVQSGQRQRECTDTFLPALVEVRVRLDKPAGIAAMDKEQGREALVNVAKEEWKNDSTDEAISGMCSRVAGKMGVESITEARRCLEAKTCEEFVPCQVKLLEAHHLR